MNVVVQVKYFWVIFQAATGLEDIETSISVLEQHGWNLAVSEC